jgi:hypothetical protein
MCKAKIYVLDDRSSVVKEDVIHDHGAPHRKTIGPCESYVYSQMCSCGFVFGDERGIGGNRVFDMAGERWQEVSPETPCLQVVEKVKAPPGLVNNHFLKALTRSSEVKNNLSRKK